MAARRPSPRRKQEVSTSLRTQIVTVLHSSAVFASGCYRVGNAPGNDANSESRLGVLRCPEQFLRAQVESGPKQEAAEFSVLSPHWLAPRTHRG